MATTITADALLRSGKYGAFVASLVSSGKFGNFAGCLLRSGKYSDFTVYTEGLAKETKRYNVHRDIIAGHSDYFRTLLDSDQSVPCDHVTFPVGHPATTQIFDHLLDVWYDVTPKPFTIFDDNIQADVDTACTYLGCKTSKVTIKPLLGPRMGWSLQLCDKQRLHLAMSENKLTELHKQKITVTKHRCHQISPSEEPTSVNKEFVALFDFLLRNQTAGQLGFEVENIHTGRPTTDEIEIVITFSNGKTFSAIAPVGKHTNLIPELNKFLTGYVTRPVAN